MSEAARGWVAETLSFKARVVCAGCNNGWMHDLEESARPFLEPLIRGQSATLDAEGREQVAYWALKTALIGGYLHSADVRAVEARELPALYEAQAVLPHTFVWIGASTSSGGLMRHRSLYIGDAKLNGFGCTLNLGFLVIEVLRIEMESGKTLKIGGQLDPALLRIWPQDQPTLWPPALLLTEEQVLWLGGLITLVPVTISPSE